MLGLDVKTSPVLDNVRVLVHDEDGERGNALASEVRRVGYAAELLEGSAALQAATSRSDALALLFRLDREAGPSRATSVFHRARAQVGRRLPVLAVSERSDEATRFHAAGLGARALLPSPVPTERLMEELDALAQETEDGGYRILIMDDQPTTVVPYVRGLHLAGLTVEVVSDPFDLTRVLDAYRPDLLLMDMYMPGCDGIELTSALRLDESLADLPIVFLCSETRMGKELAAFGAGADGYLAKPIDTEHLATLVTGLVRRRRLAAWRRKRDSLTGLPQGEALRAEIRRLLDDARARTAPLLAARVDLTALASINDTHGLWTGDRVLQDLALLLRRGVRKTDLLGRWQEDEFVVLFRDAELPHARQLLENLRVQFAHLHSGDHDIWLTASFSYGVSLARQDDDVEALLARAGEVSFPSKAPAQK
ncbi:MAG: response regulator [Planctomycetes bacterium]|nr:response regulator [Planctomycetota bacterium]